MQHLKGLEFIKLYSPCKAAEKWLLGLEEMSAAWSAADADAADAWSVAAAADAADAADAARKREQFEQANIVRRIIPNPFLTL